MRLTPAIGALFLLTNHGPVLAGDGAPGAAGPPIAFPQVTGSPIPLQSVGGRFSSLNPVKQLDCPYQEVSGRVSRLV